MKKFSLTAFTSAAVLVLAACGGGEEDTEAPADEQNEGTQDDTQDDTAQDDNGGSWYEDLEIDEYDLDADYGDGQYEVDYDYNDGSPEAEIEDSRDGESTTMEGEEALNELENILPSMNVTADSAEGELLDESLQAFELEEDYEDIDIDVEFKNDDELETEDEQDN